MYSLFNCAQYVSFNPLRSRGNTLPIGRGHVVFREVQALPVTTFWTQPPIVSLRAPPSTNNVDTREWKSSASSKTAIQLPFLTTHPNGKAWEPSKGSSAQWSVEYSRLLPCPQDQLPPRVEQMVVMESGNVVDLVSRALCLPPMYVEDLVEFGAVHYALLCPSPPPTATTEQLEVYKQFSFLQDHKARPSCKGKTAREAQKTYRVIRKDLYLEAGSYLRVHVHPKRFPRCYDTNWRQKILFQTESFLVLDKPAGVSVGGTVDNIEETSAMFVARAIGLERPLCITHQIDNGTEGCVVLAKTEEFSSKFHELMRSKKMKKVYRALTVGPVPVGRMIHYMRPDRHSPRLLSLGSHEKWQRCEMEVISCKQVPWPSPSTMKKYGVKSCGWKEQPYAYEITLELLTGRTHQVRLQCAAVGSPLLGDSMYIPAVIARLNSPDIDPCLSVLEVEDERSWIGNIKDRRDGGPMERWLAAHGREPECAIGLQAFQLCWDDDGHIFEFEAGSPWWSIP
ncbi:hypothetical protein MPTK1_7g08400 [Marchantia polymorpha subsp. ruderalis]|uniref:Pseudouridine synthase RsuA/RluA-like domain-containing protein n=2 Tax=Marchantia polymorpha TaxID=3197 RepID=A0AAF6BXE2_MARPO|nr:hypothetical protein MARPO_0146s0040 [Marchantia polymorpha]BBN16676.1 hypothetical protein Mp_7g08400 [Marchantia polymorpha subsp. ruderalis]|eukprot:PTQ29224.1 hypothetical protein MARPO_0146s0040 [Marchantia polymorpha]